MKRILVLILFCLSAYQASHAQNVSIFLDFFNPYLSQPSGLALNTSGDLLISGQASDNIYRFGADASITEIIDNAGDGSGITISSPGDMALDHSGNLFVATDQGVIRVASDGVLTRMINVFGDSLGNTLSGLNSIAVDQDGNLYVSGASSNNVFRISPEGLKTEIIDFFGDGLGNILDAPGGLATDSNGNVYVSGIESNNVFRITPEGAITQVINFLGDGISNNLEEPRNLAVDGADNLYLLGRLSNNVFKVEPSGAISTVITSAGDGRNFLLHPSGLAVSDAGIVYVSGELSNNAFRVTSDGHANLMIDKNGTSGTEFVGPENIVADENEVVYIIASNRVFKIEDANLPVELTSFEARSNGNNTVLAWQTATEKNNAGFEVQRLLKGSWQTVTFVKGAGNSLEPINYSYLVKDLFPGSHSFRLKQIDFDGSTWFSDLLDVSIYFAHPFTLSRAFPNPFTHQSQFNLMLSQTQFVRIEVFNTLGQQVALLHDGVLEGNLSHPFTIDGLNLANGMYIYQVTGANFIESNTVTFRK